MRLIQIRSGQAIQLTGRRACAFEGRVELFALDDSADTERQAVSDRPDPRASQRSVICNQCPRMEQATQIDLVQGGCHA